MRAWFACSGAALIARSIEDTLGRLAAAQADRGLSASAEQNGAWAAAIEALRTAVAANDGADWTIALEYDLVRLEKRIDAVVLTDRAILVLEFKSRAADAAGLRQVEDYALDLRDFHEGSRSHPIVPILVAGEVVPRPVQRSLPWPDVAEPFSTMPDGLSLLIGEILAAIPAPEVPLDGEAWLAAPYRPVPTIIEAASMLYARHGVAEIVQARADAANLTRTAAAIDRAIERAKWDRARTIVFVTGIPGSGKTLCGLNAVFGRARAEGAAFLSGNVPLIAVLRAALARDAAARRVARGEAERRVKAALQNVHRFLEDYAASPGCVPAERVVVFDEAQRAWDEAKARQGTQRRPGRLTMSEAAHMLEIMGRTPDWAVIVALIGNGQEINTGEAGLAEWGRAIAATGEWRAVAAPCVLETRDPVQRLADSPQPWLALDPDLHLDIAVRSVRDAAATSWVEALLAGRTDEARRITDETCGVPYFLTRDPAAFRAALRAMARGNRRAGLVRASTAKRLRADGFGLDVAGDAIASWFLERWPDVRASDALELCATEYACQGLELDVVGLVWGNDLLPARAGWRARRFAGTRWHEVRNYARYIVNTYRVLLTRARYETVILVPTGDAEDPTRPPAEFDAIAERLVDAGVRSLDLSAAASRLAYASKPVPTVHQPMAAGSQVARPGNR